jgi:hypothetical protein
MMSTLRLESREIGYCSELLSRAAHRLIRLCNAENLPKLIMSGTPGLSNVAMVHLEIDWLGQRR